MNMMKLDISHRLQMKKGCGIWRIRLMKTDAFFARNLRDGVYQEFEYDDKNRRNTIKFSESGKKKEVYEYNDQRLTDRVIYEDGTCLSYEYSDNNMRTLQVSRTGIRTSWQYDDYDRKICETSPDGLETHLSMTKTITW